MKTVYKYPTGGVIPDKARYLCTLTETDETTEETALHLHVKKRNTLVWHYYEVRCEPRAGSESQPCRVATRDEADVRK